ncbi:MAG TPA: DUF5317 domain-containing protein [Gaiellaceae bacterium]|jgi:hypothetical protein|nr:DUF5317 domain-containing protein [Gaiellaceae bacterium]
MAQLLPILVALPIAFALGGRPGRLAGLRLRGLWLFFLAIGIQVVAFPFAFLPWTTGDGAARTLWLVSYGCLLAAAALNRHLLGAQVVALGMALNLAAILANGGRMPATPDAMQAAGLDFVVKHNSVAAPDPALPWLVDRFAAPDWVPLATVFSLGDVVIALGSVLLVLAATGARLPGRGRILGPWAGGEPGSSELP